MIDFLGATDGAATVGVVPILVGPAQALLAALPGILVALGTLVVTMFKPRTMKRLGQLLWSQKLIVMPVVVVVAGLIYGWSVLGPHGSGGASALVGGDKSWAAMRGGADRRAFVGGKTVEDPAQGKVNWSFSDGKINTFYCAPAVVGNRLYVSAANYGYFNDVGAVYSIDTETGKVVWAFQGDKYRSTFSSPAVAGKYLVVGEGLHETKDSRVFCLDIEQSEKKHQGVKLWDYRTTSHMESSPCIAGDRMMIGAGDDGVLCLALEPDKDGHAQKLWQLPGKEFPDCESAPLVVDGKVYFGLGREIHEMCCAEAKDGRVIWKVETPAPTGSPAIAGRKMYFGMGVGDFVNDAADLRKQKQKIMQEQGKSAAEIEAALVELKTGGEVWCIDLATHKVDWKFPVGDTILGTPAVDGERVYVGSRDGNLYCLSTAGQLVRKFNAHGPIVSGPAVGNKFVYVLTTNGLLYGLDKVTLGQVWSVGFNCESFSSPTVADGHVYLGTNGGGLLCVGEPGVEKAEAVWAGELGGAGKSGAMDGSLIPTGGTFAWGSASSEDEGEAGAGMVVQSPAACIGDTFYVGVQEKDACGVAALACTGSLDHKPAQQWFAPTMLPVTSSPAATEKYVFVVEGRAGNKGRQLRCFDRQTGKHLLSLPVGEEATGELVIAADRLFISDLPSCLTCLDVSYILPFDPRTFDRDKYNQFFKTLIKWTTIKVGPSVGPPALGDDLVAVAVKAPDQLVVMDRASGQILWTEKLPSRPLTGVVIAGDRVWVGTAEGLRGYSLVQGEAPQVVDCGPVTGRIIAEGERLVCVTASGELIVVDAEKGTIAARLSGVNTSVGPILAGDTLLYAAKDSLVRYDLRTKQGTLWAKISATWPGTLVTPMIMVDSHVLFGTDKRGLVCYKPKKGS